MGQEDEIDQTQDLNVDPLMYVRLANMLGLIGPHVQSLGGSTAPSRSSSVPMVGAPEYPLKTTKYQPTSPIGQIPQIAGTAPGAAPVAALGASPMATAQGPQTALEHYKQLLSQMPQRNQYQPSKLRRVIAAVEGGLTGMNYGPQAGEAAGTDILQRPYEKALQNWSSQLAPVEAQTQLEGQEAVQQRLAEKAAFDEQHIKNQDALASRGIVVKESAEKRAANPLITKQNTINLLGPNGKPMAYQITRDATGQLVKTAIGDVEQKVQPLTLQDRIQLEAIKSGLGLKEATQADAIKKKTALTNEKALTDYKSSLTPFKPADQASAQKQAIANILNENPGAYDDLFPVVNGKPTYTPRARNAFIHPLSPNQDKLDALSTEFWKRVHQEQLNILKQTRGTSGGAGNITITPEK